MRAGNRSTPGPTFKPGLFYQTTIILSGLSMRYKNSATVILFYNNRLILKSNQFLRGFGFTCQHRGEHHSSAGEPVNNALESGAGNIRTGHQETGQYRGAGRGHGQHRRAVPVNIPGGARQHRDGGGKHTGIRKPGGHGQRRAGSGGRKPPPGRGTRWGTGP